MVVRWYTYIRRNSMFSSGSLFFFFILMKYFGRDWPIFFQRQSAVMIIIVLVASPMSTITQGCANSVVELLADSWYKIWGLNLDALSIVVWICRSLIFTVQVWGTASMISLLVDNICVKFLQ